MRLYFSTAFQRKTTERSQKTKPLFQQKSRNPHQASLCACNKAAAAFEKCGFISARPFVAKQLRGHKKQSRPFNKKAAIRTRLHCTRTTKPQRLSKNPALFQHGLST
jgi:hypothetical protein